MEGSSAPADAVALRLGEVLREAVRELAAAGEAERASELAAEAWSVARSASPAVAAKLNATMHAIAAHHLAHLPPVTEAGPMTVDELDVRAHAPARRHELILSAYAELGPGAGFVLVNDHDPKPLYYQFAAEYPGQFTWDYRATGPEVWKVRIGRPQAA